MVDSIGPYRVYERLGIGGMGEVYKAYDDRLERWVAIKRIRTDRGDPEENRERFKREARATARLNHPSIVHLYDIFQDGDSDCIVMEYVEGKSLDAILAEGPLDQLGVTKLGQEVAAGLAEAHSNGILHRDLKAENIIITSKGRAKILDFGLAKPILARELDEKLTEKGQLVGTSRAMSPEYVGGAEPDHRSDLFALGVLLYESATGVSPFKAHNSLATLKQVMMHKQKPVKEMMPQVLAELSDWIDQLLAKDPDERPQSAQEISAAFGRLAGQMSSTEHEAPASGGQTHFSSSSTLAGASDTMLDLRPPRRFFTAISVAALVVITAFGLGWLINRPKPLKPLVPGQQVRLLLGTFENDTGQERFTDSIAQIFRAGLEQSESISLLDRAQVRDALGRMQKAPDAPLAEELALELAQREGVDRLVVGRIDALGGRYSLSAKVLDPESGRTTRSFSRDAKAETGILPAIDALAAEIREHLGETAVEIKRTSQPLEQVTTPNFEALKAYSSGVAKLSDERPIDALPFLERALQLDPGFGMAHAKLGVAYSNLGRKADALHHIDAALGQSDRLSSLDRSYIEAWAARWRGTPQEVVDSWTVISELHPRVFSGHWNLGSALWLYRQDFEGAKDAFTNALAVARGADRTYAAYRVGMSYLALGQLTEAERAFRSAESRHQVEGLIDLARVRGDRDEAEELLSRYSFEDKPWQARKALGMVERGQLQSAMKAFVELRDSLIQDRSKPLIFWSTLSDEATLEAALGLRRELADSVDLAFGLLESSSQDDLLSENSALVGLTLLGKWCARNNDIERLERLQAIVGRFEKERIPVAWGTYLLALDAEIALAHGRENEVREILQKFDEKTSSVFALETLAFINLQLGEHEAASRSYHKIVEQRAGAMLEGSESSSGRVASSLFWYLAHLEGAKLALKLGDRSEAQRLSAQLLEAWAGSDSEGPFLSAARDVAAAAANVP